MHPGALRHRQPPGAGARLRRGPRPDGECAYFSTQKLRVEEALTLEAGEESFLSLVCVEGGGLLCGPENILEFTAGESLLVPAGTGKVSLRGDCTVIQTTVPGQA